MCAIDALGVGAMYGTNTLIESRCRLCRVAIGITTVDHGRRLDTVLPGETMVFAGIACFASSWTPAMVRRWHADPFGFLRPWGEVPALIGSAPPATPPSTGTGVVILLMG
jgi:hypothetical protein